VAKNLTSATRPETFAARLLDRLPGGAFVKEQLDRVEHLALGELKQRLDRLEQSPSVSVLAVSVSAQQRQRRRTPGALLRQLLAQSADQSREQAVEAFYVSILRGMVPDQARILSVLSDGSGYPFIHVMASSKLGLSAVPMLEYASTVGRAARVVAGELTPAYVRQMAHWGLIETAPEDPAQRVHYELLETEESVRRLIARIEKNGERSRIVRRSLKISELGLALWHLCQLDDEAP
jgi:hypothetical protein